MTAAFPRLPSDEAPEASVARCLRVYDALRSGLPKEDPSGRVRLKMRAVDKLRKLLGRGRISEALFLEWKRRIADL